MIYFELKCTTCNRTAPFVATERHEVENPSPGGYSCCGHDPQQTSGAEALLAFRHGHKDHELTINEIESDLGLER